MEGDQTACGKIGFIVIIMLMRKVLLKWESLLPVVMAWLISWEVGHTEKS